MEASLGAVRAAAAAVGSDVVISWGQLSGMQQGKKMLMIMLRALPSPSAVPRLLARFNYEEMYRFCSN